MTHQECRDAETVVNSLVLEYTTTEIREGELLAKLGNPPDHAAALKAIDTLKDYERQLQEGIRQHQREKSALNRQVDEEQRHNVAIAISFGLVGILFGFAVTYGIWGIK